jgi:hypothetical protein
VQSLPTMLPEAAPALLAAKLSMPKNAMIQTA